MASASLFSRNIGYFTPKTIYFYYLKKNLDQSIQNTFYFVLKTEALDMAGKLLRRFGCSHCRWLQPQRRNGNRQ